MKRMFTFKNLKTGAGVQVIHYNCHTALESLKNKKHFDIMEYTLQTPMGEDISNRKGLRIQNIGFYMVYK